MNQPDPTAPVPPALMAAFEQYEQALMADDVEALTGFFLDDPGVLRADPLGVLEGREQIDRFRSRRGGAAARTVESIHARPAGEDRMLLVSRSRTARGGLGLLTQLWVRTSPAPDERWVIEAAHVAPPAPAIDSTVWRELGAPLVAAAADGALAGKRVAVKDLYAVAGHRIGVGVPTYLAGAEIEPAHAAAVQTLLDAGAEVTGIAQTDQFAYSISGRNPHYGTPPNPAVRGGLPGGSSSGPASAVALGHADIGLATDTAGSVRVPASYQGLWGLRTTHGDVPVDGLVPLAPRFDTVGWLTRDGETLDAVVRANLREPSPRAEDEAVLRAVISPDLLALVEPDVREAFRRTLDTLVECEVVDRVREIEIADIPGLHEAFRLTQSAEAWAVRGDWVEAHPGAVVGDEADRFAQASQITAAEASAAEARLADRRRELEQAFGQDVLLLPTAPTAAPDAHASAADVQSARVATLSMTCVATMMGRPGLSVPVMDVADGPVGLCLVGPRHSDVSLVGMGRRIGEALAAGE